MYIKWQYKWFANKFLFIIGHSKQEGVYVHVSYFERFPRCSYFTMQYTVHCTDEHHAMSSHELQSAVVLTVESSKIYEYYNRVGHDSRAV
jgi:hypothetical protein